MARAFDRRLSLGVTRRLLGTRVEPNYMTLLSTGIGLAGALQFLLVDHVHELAGASLIWLHTVLDGCDGELARLRFQESPFGSDLDFWTDNLVHLALFGSMGYGFYRASGDSLDLSLALAANLGVLSSAGLAFWRRIQRRRQEAHGEASAEALPPGLLQRIESFLAQRDFIYLLLILASWNLTHMFLWAGAIGAPLFFIFMLAAGKSSLPPEMQSAAT